MRPQPTEAASYYFAYIDRVPTDDVVKELENQLSETTGFLSGISKEKSLYRYAPDKWSIREVLSHVNDTERVFLFRALWFARGFPDPLPAFDQNICVKAAEADKVPWEALVNEFRSIREATIAFFQALPAAAWDRNGIASDNPFTVRALAYIIAGHASHHTDVIRNLYL